MNDVFADPNWFEMIARAMLFFATYLLAGLVPVCVILYSIYVLMTLPLRRQERARLFFDVVESGLSRGTSPEQTVASVAGTRDLAFGVRFYLVADQVAQGKRLSEALEAVPRFVQPEIRAIWRAGERMGNVQAVLPVCRQVLQDAVSQVRGALNYLALLLFAVTPALIFVPLVLQTHVLPKYREVFSGLAGTPLPAFTRFVLGQQPLFILVEVGILLFLWGALFAYVGGPRLGRWVEALVPGLVDRLNHQLPWKRKRLQRDFSSLLALLLDARVPEPEAVRLAAEGVNNRVVQARASLVERSLAAGTSLPEAMAAMDDEGELRWRLRNGSHGTGGFVHALSGWHEALNAKAFQLEQTAAQVATTLLVLLNGVVVGMLVVAIFLALIAITNEATLW